MRMETFIRKSLRLKAHTVVKVELREADEGLVVQIERLGHRRLRCGACGGEARRVAPTRRPERRWHDLAMRTHQVWLVYAPYRVWCRQCGLRVEQIPWADQWQRVTHALARSKFAMLVGGAKRLYGIVEGGDLAYVEERVDADGGLVPHLSARLTRYVG